MIKQSEAQKVAQMIERAAAAEAGQRFAHLAITVYFQRLIAASERQLIAAQLRPVLVPVAAELALQRAQRAQSFRDFLRTLMNDQALVASLAIRAVSLYAQRFAVMDNAAIGKEIGRRASFDVSAAAAVVWQNLLCIDPSLSN